jgi:hypothetical protein
MVSDCVHLVRLCLADELGELGRVEEASWRKHERLRWLALVGAVDDVFQSDHVCCVLIRVDSSPDHRCTFGPDLMGRPEARKKSTAQARHDPK